MEPLFSFDRTPLGSQEFPLATSLFCVMILNYMENKGGEMKKTAYIKGILMVSFLINQGALGQKPGRWGGIKREMADTEKVYLGLNKEEATEGERKGWEEQLAAIQFSHNRRSLPSVVAPVVSQAEASRHPVSPQADLNERPLVCMLSPAPSEEKPAVKGERDGNKKPSPVDASEPEKKQPSSRKAGIKKQPPSVAEAVLVGAGYVAVIWGALGYIFYTSAWPHIREYAGAAYEKYVAFIRQVDSFLGAVGEVYAQTSQVLGWGKKGE